jgi:hypothetical protein
MSATQTHPTEIASSGPAAVAMAFIQAYQRADDATLHAMSSADATARYAPTWNSGHTPIAAAITAWAKYPAAFADFAMSITTVVEDIAGRRAVVTTLNSGVHINDVDGITARDRTLGCTHLFAIELDANGLINYVEVWCDQLTLFQQLGFPAEFRAEVTS